MQLKQLERAWRRVWIRMLTRALALTRRRAQAGGAPRTVLFLRPDRIGDMVVSTGVLRVIASARADITLDVLASPANAPVARAEPFIRQVLVFDRRRPWRWPAAVVRLRRARYDAVVDCMVTAPSVTMLLLMLAIGARERIGVAGRGNDDALTIAVPPRAGARHIIDHLSALAAAFGVDLTTADFSPSLTLTAEERRRALGIWEAAVSNVGMAQRLLVNVSAGKAARYWPEEYFIELLGIVRHRAPAVQPLIIGGPEDRERVLAVSRAAGVATAQTATLRDALAFVGTADVVLSADTGLAHAAAAFRRPAIVLHRRGSAVLWGLYGAPGVALESEDASIRSISVDQVWRALQGLLPSQTLVTPTDPPRPREDDGRPAASARST